MINSRGFMIKTKNVTQRRHCHNCNKPFTTNHQETRQLCEVCMTSPKYCVTCGEQLKSWNRDRITCDEKCEKKLGIIKKKVMVCHYCNKEIKDKDIEKGEFIFEKSENKYGVDTHAHIMCEYNSLKNNIKYSNDRIAQNKQELEVEQKDIEESTKKIDKLTKKYPEKITMEIL
jgi:hypothetical protein